MKLPTENRQPNPPSLPPQGHSRKRRGVALILVVSFIVLISALVIGFFSRVSTDLAGARSYAEGVGVRQLADSAVSVVMGQIRSATTVKNGCWASQPGMIRVYGTDSGTASSQAYAFYKLYSSHDLVVSKNEMDSFRPTDFSAGGNITEVPLGKGGWSAQPAFFTDLNEPADVPDPSPSASIGATIKRFPIFDPSIATISSLGLNPPNNPNSTSKWVEGCEVMPSVPVTELKDSANKLRAPMPVRWIYVLKDGTMTAPTPLTVAVSAGTNAGLKAKLISTKATKENPIVGRIAFWTDDETCKVNLNTAGGYVLPNGMNENTPDYITAGSFKQLSANPDTPQAMPTNAAMFAGSFWDTPRVQTIFDRGTNIDDTNTIFRGGLANTQPGQHEFQRYPGHPATTDLGLVFQHLLPVATTGLDSEKLYQLTPRLMPGGSKGGTQRLSVTVNKALDIKEGFDPDKNNNPTDTYHLYASVDEFLYSTKNDIMSGNGAKRKRADEAIGINADTINPTLVDQLRFFVTTHSRSPELNLFGRPRVAIWPVPSRTPGSDRESKLEQFKPPLINASDDLIRFCSTVGRDPATSQQLVSRQGEFIFDRYDPYDSASDFQRPRNAKVFDYLHSLATSAIPGWGGSLGTKYVNGADGGGVDQILVEIFDYIRSVNLRDSSRDRDIDLKSPPQESHKDPTTGKPTRGQPTALNNQLKQEARYAPHGIVIPTSVTYHGKAIKGFGRFPTISEASLVFYHGGWAYTRNSAPVNDVLYSVEIKQDVDNNTPNGQKWKKDHDFKEWKGQLVRAFLIFETFNPMQGYAPVDGLSDVSLVDTKLVDKDSKAFIRYPVEDWNENPSKKANRRIAHVLKGNLQFNITGEQQGLVGTLKIGDGVTPDGQLGGIVNYTAISSGQTWAGRNFGGTEGFFHTLQGKTLMKPTPPVPASLTNTYYPFQTKCLNKMDGALLGMNDTTFRFSGFNASVEVRFIDTAPQAHNESIQTLTLNFLPGQGWPVPKGDVLRQERGGLDPRAKFPNPYDTTTSPPNYDIRGIFNAGGVETDGTAQSWANFINKPTGGTPPLNKAGAGYFGLVNTDVAPFVLKKTANFQQRFPDEEEGWPMPFHFPARIAWAAQTSDSPWGKFDINLNLVGDDKHYGGRFLQVIQAGDTVRSLIPGGNNPGAGDTRVVALQGTSPSKPAKNLLPHPDYGGGNRFAQTLRRGDGGFYLLPTNIALFPGDAAKPLTGSLTKLQAVYPGSSGPDLARGTGFAKRSWPAGGGAADFDNGLGNFPDGPFCGKPDEGNEARFWVTWKTVGGKSVPVQNKVEPYFSTYVYDDPMDTYFSPNRQIPSPVMFGSLLASQTSWDNSGWKTLLFCPNPAGDFPVQHPGHDPVHGVPDHLLLDLFNMPVVEPYAISEPFSTDGKVNLNYQLMPFGYIKRSTALRAALRPLRVTAIPNSLTKTSGGVTQLAYKAQDNPQNLRYLVDRDETLKAFDDQYDSGNSPGGNKSQGFFKSASQICERFLYPKGQLVGVATPKWKSGDAEMKGNNGFWSNNALTGDNVREKPYSDLYSRITTKSNTFTVHYRVQTLRQRPYTGTGSASTVAAYYQTWDEGRDQVLSEYRGHTTIERYLDPEDPRFQPTYTPAPGGPPKIDVENDSLEDAYRFRVIYNKRFSPW